MDKKVKQLVHALWVDLHKTYPSLTETWLVEEAERQLRGEKPTGGPGAFLADYLHRAGFVK
jgi:hypothetical protein